MALDFPPLYVEPSHYRALRLESLHDVAAVQLVTQLAVVFQRPDAMGDSQASEIG